MIYNLIVVPSCWFDRLHQFDELNWFGIALDTALCCTVLAATAQNGLLTFSVLTWKFWCNICVTTSWYIGLSAYQRCCLPKLVGIYWNGEIFKQQPLVIAVADVLSANRGTASVEAKLIKFRSFFGCSKMIEDDTWVSKSFSISTCCDDVAWR